MKKEMTLTTSTLRSEKVNNIRLSSVWACVKAAVLCSRPIVSLARLYTQLLGEPISPLQTLHLLNAQLSFLMLVFPLSFTIMVRILFLVWFGVALLQCRRAGLGR